LVAAKKGSESSQAKYKYPVLTLEILKAIPDEKLEAAIVDHADYKIGDNSDGEYKIVTGLSKGLQIIYSTWLVEEEVDNGGFNQYFWNSSGQYQKEALEGFKLLGAKEHAGLMDEAIAIYNQEAANEPMGNRRSISFWQCAQKTGWICCCRMLLLPPVFNKNTMKSKWRREGDSNPRQ